MLTPNCGHLYWPNRVIVFEECKGGEALRATACTAAFAASYSNWSLTDSSTRRSYVQPPNKARYGSFGMHQQLHPENVGAL